MSEDTKLVIYSWKTSLLTQSLLCADMFVCVCAFVCVYCIFLLWQEFLTPLCWQHSLNTRTLAPKLERIEKKTQSNTKQVSIIARR